MKKGKCPKCQSNEIYMRDECGLHIRGSAYGVQVLADNRMIKMFTYLCASCGYVELYADDKTDDRKEFSRLEMLQKDKDWKKIGDNTPPFVPFLKSE